MGLFIKEQKKVIGMDENSTELNITFHDAHLYQTDDTILGLSYMPTGLWVCYSTIRAPYFDDEPVGILEEISNRALLRIGTHLISADKSEAEKAHEFIIEKFPSKKRPLLWSKFETLLKNRKNITYATKYLEKCCLEIEDSFFVDYDECMSFEADFYNYCNFNSIDAFQNIDCFFCGNDILGKMPNEFVSLFEDGPHDSSYFSLDLYSELAELIEDIHVDNELHLCEKQLLAYMLLNYAARLKIIKEFSAYGLSHDKLPNTQEECAQLYMQLHGLDLDNKDNLLKYSYCVQYWREENVLVSIQSVKQLMQVLRPIVSRLIKEQNIVAKRKALFDDEIIAYDINDVDLMSGRDFEIFIQELFNKMGYKTTITPASNDQGVDVIAEKNGLKYGIQTKCYSKSVGNASVQEVVAGCKFYGCDKAIVITNRDFTKSAINLANSNNVTLWGRDVLIEKIREVF